MSENPVLTWSQVKTELERRLRQTDQQLRRAKGDQSLALQGRAQCLEELMSLPEAIQLTEEKTGG